MADEPRRARSEPEQHAGEQFDDPNRQAVGLEPAWTEGTGGTGAAQAKGRGGKPRQPAAADKAAEKPAEKAAEKPAEPKGS
jgi:hypothetical protein